MSDTTDPRKVIDSALCDYYGDDRRILTDEGRPAGALWGMAAFHIMDALEAAGFRLVPTDLVDNARDVCGSASDEDWTIVRKTSFDALASSFAALDGDDPLNVFAGKP